MADVTELNDARILEAARRYAEANNSDPFAYARCICHFNQGLLGPTEDGSPGHYDAERDGITGWRNICRL
jgi:hypothetical protein